MDFNSCSSSVIMEIFSYLNDPFILSLVCRQFYNLIKNSTFITFYLSQRLSRLSITLTTNNSSHECSRWQHIYMPPERQLRQDMSRLLSSKGSNLLDWITQNKDKPWPTPAKIEMIAHVKQLIPPGVVPGHRSIWTATQAAQLYTSLCRQGVSTIYRKTRYYPTSTHLPSLYYLLTFNAIDEIINLVTNHHIPRRDLQKFLFLLLVRYLELDKLHRRDLIPILCLLSEKKVMISGSKQARIILYFLKEGYSESKIASLLRTYPLAKRITPIVIEWLYRYRYNRLAGALIDDYTYINRVTR